MPGFRAQSILCLLIKFVTFLTASKPIFQKNDLAVLMKYNIKLLQELDETIKIDFKITLINSVDYL